MPDSSRSIPITVLISTSLWAWIVVSMCAGWVFMLFGYFEVAAMLGFTSCASTGVAATLSVRGFVLRTQGLIRATAGLNGARPDVRPELHQIT